MSETLPPLAETPCCALVDALSEVLPHHALACVSRLNLHDKPWSFDVTDDGRSLITPESCRCSSGSTRYLRGLLPAGHPKGFSHNIPITDADPTAPIPKMTFPTLQASHCSMSFEDWWNDHKNGCPTLVLDNDEQFARAVWDAAVNAGLSSLQDDPARVQARKALQSLTNPNEL